MRENASFRFKTSFLVGFVWEGLILIVKIWQICLFLNKLLVTNQIIRIGQIIFNLAKHDVNSDSDIICK